MEASIEKAVEVALSIIDDNPDMERTVVTDTVPTLVEQAGERRIREVSAIHITLKKKLEFWSDLWLKSCDQTQLAWDYLMALLTYAHSSPAC